MNISSSNRLVIFVHIQKTAGQTFRTILNQKFGSDRCLEIGKSAHHVSIQCLGKMPKEKRDEFHCVMAHLPYGLHTYFDKPCYYITLLRDPVERAVSQFFYICRTPSNERYRLIKETDFSFLSYVEHDEFGRSDNMQIRYIINDFVKEKIDMEGYELAKDALLKKFALFGITERFEDTIKLLETSFKWRIHKFKNKNVTKNRPALNALDPKAIRLLQEKNYYDLLLYQFALKHFETMAVNIG